jgi:hypothetical protein
MKTAKGNEIVLSRGLDSYIKRVIPIEEVAASEHYDDMADLAVIFNHEIIEDKGGTWRWKSNRLACLFMEYAPVYAPSTAEMEADGMKNLGRRGQSIRASLDLNNLAVDLDAGLYTVEEKMKFMMQIGYSLSGYAELFGQHEASEYDLPCVLPTPEDHDGENYVETVIEYMRRVHKGKVLKL